MAHLSLADVARLRDTDRPTIWMNGESGANATIGFGEYARFEASGPDRFETLARRFNDLCGSLPAHTSGVRAFVSASFSSVSGHTSVLIVPAVQYQIGPTGTRVIDLRPDDAASPSAEHTGTVARAANRTEAPAGVTAEQSPTPPSDGESRGPATRIVAEHGGDLSEEAFVAAVERAVGLIEAGELSKTVIARDAVLDLDGALPIGALARELNATYPSCWTFYVDGLIGASPELLVSVRDGAICSRALAGSAPVTGDVDEDENRRADLLTSAKDQSEHAYAARSVVEVLRRVADVEVSQTSVIMLPTIMHLATDVHGHLTGRHSALQVAGLVHPSAAICGTPREAAARVIADLEGFDRGRYSAPVGWVDDSGNGEFVIALRCARLEKGPAGDSLRLFAGAGIVLGSDPAAELAETATKMLPIRRAVNAVVKETP
ncbi:MAG: chorismate-binding protein [Bowdeniella nasicola]|nr:chorismate-binding protein [Bowdeniella nasicola]